MGIDWLTNCKLNDQSFLSCEQQLFIKEHITFIYTTAILIVALIVAVIIYKFYSTKKPNKQ